MLTAFADAFLRDIQEEPEDDTPRLIYADWLDETGDDADRARAELIRLQIDLARRPADDPQRPALRARERLLLRQYGSAWAAPLAGVAREFQFRRGFIERARLDAGALLRHGLRAFEAHPLRHLDLIVEAGRGPALADCPLLGRVGTLNLLQTSGAAADLEAVLRSPHLSTLKTLRVHYIPDQGVAALARAPHLAQLATLDLAFSSAVGPSLPLLLEAHLPALASLNVGHCALGDHGVQALAASPWLGRLSALDLVGNNLGPHAAVALAGSAYGSRLRILWLSHNAVRDAGACALAGSQRLALTRLYLARNGLGSAGVRGLAGAPALAGLTHLDLDYNELPADALLSLAGSPYLHHLQALFVRCGPGVSSWTRWRLRSRFGERVCHF